MRKGKVSLSEALAIGIAGVAIGISISSINGCKPKYEPRQPTPIQQQILQSQYDDS